MKHTTCLLLLLCLLYKTVAQETDNCNCAVIHGEISSPVTADTIIISYWDHYIDPYATIVPPVKKVVLTAHGNIFDGAIGNRVFELVIPVKDRSVRLDLSDGSDTYFERFLIEAGDTVRTLIDTKRGMVLFGGPDAPKYRLQHDLQVARQEQEFRGQPVMFTENSQNFFEREDYLQSYEQAQASVAGRKLRMIENKDKFPLLLEDFFDDPRNHPGFDILQRYADKVDQRFLRIMEADLYGAVLHPRLFGFNKLLSREKDIVEFYETHIIPMKTDMVGEEYALLSPNYRDFLLLKAIIISRMSKTPVIEIIASEYSGNLRDVLITSFLVKYHKFLLDLDSQLKIATDIVSLPRSAKIIADLAATKMVGNEYGDYLLKDTSGKDVTITGLGEKILLLDFWFTGCKACISFYDNVLSKVEDHFRGNTEFLIVSISSDKKLDVWRRSINSGRYTSPENINLNTEGPDHQMLQDYSIYEYPNHILLDSSGRIARASRFPNDADQLIALIEETINKSK